MSDVSKLVFNGVEYGIKDNKAAREALVGSTNPTSSTVGVLGQFYTNLSSNMLFQCTNVNRNVYTWEIVGGVAADEIYIGPTAPTDNKIKVWVDTSCDGACIDMVPIPGSINAVSSGGVYATLDQKADSPTVVTGTLTAGQTSIVLSDEVFTTSSIVDIYTDIYGKAPSDVVLNTGTLTLTFAEVLSSDLGIRVEVR